MYNSEAMNQVIVTEATSDDAKDIAEIQKEGWLTTYVNEEIGVTKEAILQKGLGNEEYVQRWKEGVTKPGTKTWVAKENGRAVGFCFVKTGESVNQLGALYVLSSTRGGGIGTKLMEQALAFLGDEKSIELEVASYNHNAISFYERFGFKSVGDIEMPTSGGLPSGGQIPKIKMVLEQNS